jgi:hypothetical protein
VKAIVKRQTILAQPKRHKFVVFRSHPGPPGTGSTQALVALQTHVDAAEPHPIYDDMVDLNILFENALI